MQGKAFPVKTLTRAINTGRDCSISESLVYYSILSITETSLSQAMNWNLPFPSYEIKIQFLLEFELGFPNPFFELLAV